MRHPRWSSLLVLAGSFGVLACDREGPPPEKSAVATSPAKPAAAPTASAPPVDGGARAAARPLYYDRAIAEDDLRGRSLRELSLMRNTIFARAGNRFRRPWLHEHFSKEPWYEPKDTVDLSKVTKLDRENARTIADYDASLSREELERRRDEVVARIGRGDVTADDEVERSLLSQRLGEWIGEGVAPREPTALEDPSRLDQLLTIEQLSTLSRRDLRILRNTVYARRGRRFDSEVVRSYFEGASWYRPRDDYHDGMLTGVDQKNIQIIRSVEDSLGGPEHENPDYGKDGWFFAA